MRDNANYQYKHPWQRKQVYLCDIKRAGTATPYVADPEDLFDPARLRCLRLCRSMRGNTYYESVQRSSASVFANPLILPYAIGTGDDALSRDSIADIYSAYAIKVGIVRTTGAIMPVCGDIYIDDLGRFYQCDNSGRLRFLPSFFKMTERETRPSKTINKRTLPIYWWSALAGYEPEVQAAIVNSWEYDVHHMEENHFDFRPDHYAIIPSSIHRRHHSIREDFTVDFFRQTYRLASGFVPRVKRFSL